MGFENQLVIRWEENFPKKNKNDQNLWHTIYLVFLKTYVHTQGYSHIISSLANNFSKQHPTNILFFHISSDKTLAASDLLLHV